MIHINTLYNWINKYYNSETNTFNFSQFKTNFKYNNTKITNNIYYKFYLIKITILILKLNLILYYQH